MWCVQCHFINIFCLFLVFGIDVIQNDWESNNNNNNFNRRLYPFSQVNYELDGNYSLFIYIYWF